MNRRMSHALAMRSTNTPARVTHTLPRFTLGAFVCRFGAVAAASESTWRRACLPAAAPKKSAPAAAAHADARADGAASPADNRVWAEDDGTTPTSPSCVILQNQNQYRNSIHGNSAHLPWFVQFVPRASNRRHARTHRFGAVDGRIATLARRVGARYREHRMTTRLLLP